MGLQSFERGKQTAFLTQVTFYINAVISLNYNWIAHILTSYVISGKRLKVFERPRAGCERDLGLKVANESVEV